MQIGSIQLENPVFLAPMAGVTDWAFRTICAQLGAAVTVTEMVSSRALVYKDQKSAKLLRKNDGGICGGGYAAGRHDGEAGSDSGVLPEVREYK